MDASTWKSLHGGAIDQTEIKARKCYEPPSHGLASEPDQFSLAPCTRVDLFYFSKARGR